MIETYNPRVGNYRIEGYSLGYNLSLVINLAMAINETDPGRKIGTIYE